MEKMEKKVVYRTTFLLLLNYYYTTYRLSPRARREDEKMTREAKKRKNGKRVPCVYNGKNEKTRHF